MADEDVVDEDRVAAVMYELSGTGGSRPSLATLLRIRARLDMLVVRLQGEMVGQEGLGQSLPDTERRRLSASNDSLDNDIGDDEGDSVGCAGSVPPPGADVLTSLPILQDGAPASVSAAPGDFAASLPDLSLDSPSSPPMKRIATESSHGERDESVDEDLARVDPGQDPRSAPVVYVDPQDADFPTGVIVEDDDFRVPDIFDVLCPVCGVPRHDDLDDEVFAEQLDRTGADLGVDAVSPGAANPSVGPASAHAGLLRLCSTGVSDLERAVVFSRHRWDDFALLAQTCCREGRSHVALIQHLTGREFEEDLSVVGRLRRLQLLSALLEALDDSEGFSKLFLDFRCPAWTMLALSTPIGEAGDLGEVLLQVNFKRLRCEALNLLGLGCMLAPDSPQFIRALDELLIGGIVDVGIEHVFDLDDSVLSASLQALVAIAKRLTDSTFTRSAPTLVARTLCELPDAKELGGGLVSKLNRSSLGNPLELEGLLLLFQDIFSTAATADYLHTVEFEVLIDVILRNLRDIDAGHDSELLGFLRLLRAIVQHHSAFSETQPRREELALVLKQLLELYEDQPESREVSEEVEGIIFDGPFLKW
jgi:SPIN90/Ldb17, leucine-rich domain